MVLCDDDTYAHMTGKIARNCVMSPLSQSMNGSTHMRTSTSKKTHKPAK